MHLTGGCLGTINSESNGQIAQTVNYLFGMDPKNYDCPAWGYTSAVKDADRIFFGGCGSGESRMCGMGESTKSRKPAKPASPSHS